MRIVPKAEYDYHKMGLTRLRRKALGIVPPKTTLALYTGRYVHRRRRQVRNLGSRYIKGREDWRATPCHPVVSSNQGNNGGKYIKRYGR